MSRLPQIQKRALSIWVLVFLLPGFLFACNDKTAGQNSTTGKSLTLIGAEEYLPWLTAALLIAFLLFLSSLFSIEPCKGASPSAPMN